MLPVGSPAPDFELKTHSGKTARLSDYKGRKNVVLAFHPLAFTPVCATQMQTYEQEKDRFRDLDAVVFGISIDAVPSKRAWADLLGVVSFDLLSDANPQGKVASDYGVFKTDASISERAIVVVDRNGTVAWTKRYEIPEQPDPQELFGELEKLK